MRYLTIIFCLISVFGTFAYGGGLSCHEKHSVQTARELFRDETIELKGVEGPKGLSVCGMPLVVEAGANLKGISPQPQELPRVHPSRPTFADPDTFDTPSGLFRIHYTITGPDSVYQSHVDIDPFDGVPDYVNRCSDILDSVKTCEIDSLGYDAPPSDSGFPENGGDGRYDVYLLDLPYALFGYCQGEHYSPYPKATSYVALRSDYSPYAGLYEDPLDPLRLAAAHQFFHAVQFGYDATEYEYSGDPPRSKPYWMEISAVWMEDMVYDDINDYLAFLPHFYDCPWLSLTTFRSSVDLHPFASCVWAFFLSEKYGTEIIKQVWEQCAQVPGDNVLDATDEILQQPPYLTSLEDAYKEFTVWNFFTSIRADTAIFYSEGNLFDTNSMIRPVASQYHTSYPAQAPDPLPHPPQYLGANYVFFVPDGQNRDLKIDFFGDSTVTWKVSIIGYKSGDSPFIDEFILDSLQNGSVRIDGWDSYSDIVMIPAVTAREDGEFEYNYAAFPFLRGDVNEDGVVDIADVMFLINYLFIGGSPPQPMEAGDCNCDGVVDVADVMYLINYLFMGGAPPGCQPDQTQSSGI